jgi:hypothetical protein
MGNRRKILVVALPQIGFLLPERLLTDARRPDTFSYQEVGAVYTSLLNGNTGYPEIDRLGVITDSV